MKIGIIGCFYGNADLLPRVLDPWIELKRSGKAIVLAGINAQFKEYADLGYPNDDYATRSVLEDHRKDFDFLSIEEKPLMEHEVRGKLLDFLKKENVDAVWLLDGDELYTKQEIENILAYVARVPEFDCYYIHFKNILFDTTPSRDVFCPPRIIRTNRREGIQSFTWDNEIEFGDGTHLFDAVPGIIPQRIALVEHRTWRAADAKKKVDYCLRHFGYSMYMEEKTTGKIVYNKEWFDKFKLPMPITHPDGSVETPTPFIDIHLSLSPEPSVTSLWSLVRMLLVFDRANDARFRLVVPAPSPSLVSFLELFAIDVVYEEANPLHSKADLFLFVDDQHLYDRDALLVTHHAFLYFSKMLGSKKIVLNLMDNPNLYLPSGIQPARVVLGGGRHWRTTPPAKNVPYFISREARASPLGSTSFSPLPSLVVSLAPLPAPLFVDRASLERELLPIPHP